MLHGPMWTKKWFKQHTKSITWPTKFSQAKRNVVRQYHICWQNIQIYQAAVDSATLKCAIICTIYLHILERPWLVAVEDMYAPSLQIQGRYCEVVVTKHNFFFFFCLIFAYRFKVNSVEYPPMKVLFGLIWKRSWSC